jgi:hemerythrin
LDSKYILGIDELDAQHEGIESLCLALEEAVEDKDRWRNLLEKLCEKLRFHFHAEESLMDILAYPESQQHKRSHGEIIRLVEGYRDATLTDAELETLKNQPMRVISEQILTQDLRFAAFFKTNKERLGIQ